MITFIYFSSTLGFSTHWYILFIVLVFLDTSFSNYKFCLEGNKDVKDIGQRFYMTDSRVLYLNRQRVCKFLRYKKKKKHFSKVKVHLKRRFRRTMGLKYLKLFKTRLFSVVKPLPLHFLRYSLQSIKRCRDYRIYQTANFILFRRLNSLFIDIYVSRWEVDARYVTCVMPDKVNTEKFMAFIQSSKYSATTYRPFRESFMEVNYIFNRIAVLKYYLHRRYRSFSLKKPCNIFLPNIGPHFRLYNSKITRRKYLFSKLN